MNPLYLVAVVVISLLYVWTLYNIPIVVAGVRSLRSSRRKRRLSYDDQSSLPSMSIIVPVKDEEIVVGRLLNVLEKANFPLTPIILGFVLESLIETSHLLRSPATAAFRVP